MSFKNILLIILFAGTMAMFACTSTNNHGADLQRLAAWMTGSFSSQAQAEADTDYFNIQLEMVPVWTERDDGYWLYVEQAVASHLEKPYRQRVYHLTQVDDTTFRSDVYEIYEPLRFAGDWDKQAFLATLTPDSLMAREGCSIFLKKEGDQSFVGSTVDHNCLSTLQNASYATSEVRITETEMVSWDRGFDADGNQVWGAEKGGYVFKKIEAVKDH